MTLIKRALALAGYTDLTYTDKYEGPETATAFILFTRLRLSIQ